MQSALLIIEYSSERRNKMSEANDNKNKGYNLFLLVAILLIGTFCTVLNQTILATALPTLMKAFDVSTSTVQWLTTGFLMVNGVMILSQLGCQHVLILNGCTLWP